MIKPLKMQFFVLLLVMYVFGNIGIFMFGGKIRSDEAVIVNNPSLPNLYVYLNFNDIVSSFVTLFVLLAVNNWFVVMDMYTKVLDNNWYRIFFYSFWFLGVIVGLNIVVAIAIDMYRAITRLNE